MRNGVLLDDKERILIEPVAVAQRRERGEHKLFAIRRIEKGEGVSRAVRRLADLARIALQNTGGRSKPQGFSIRAQESASLRAIVNEHCGLRAARQGLKSHRSRPGENVDDMRMRSRIAIGMRENIEHGFAQPVRGWPDCIRRRAFQQPALQPAANYAHGSSWLAALRRRFLSAFAGWPGAGAGLGHWLALRLVRWTLWSVRLVRFGLLRPDGFFHKRLAAIAPGASGRRKTLDGDHAPSAVGRLFLNPALAGFSRCGLASPQR